MTKLRNIIYEIGRAVARNCPIASFKKRVNFHAIEDGACYRTSQPNKKQFVRLIEEVRPKMVVAVRRNVPEWEREILEEKGILLLHLVVGRPPEEYFTESLINTFLTHLKDACYQPLIIHCQHGRDRTGFLAAVYRIEIQGWSPQAAWDEMLRLGHGALPTGNRLRPILEKRYNCTLRGSVTYI